MPLFQVMLVASLLFSTALCAKEIQTKGKICPQPDKPCATKSYQFQPHELSFQLPQNLEWQSGHYSAYFYAIILRSVKISQFADPINDVQCIGFIPETERLAVQAQFGQRKVFTSRNGCSSMVFYTQANDNYNFIAVYAGETKTEATALLRTVKQAGFADANMRKMQVIVESGD